MLCEKCGREIADTCVFCPLCGNKTSNEYVSGSAKAPPEPESTPPGANFTPPAFTPPASPVKSPNASRDYSKLSLSLIGFSALTLFLSFGVFVFSFIQGYFFYMPCFILLIILCLCQTINAAIFCFHLAKKRSSSLGIFLSISAIIALTVLEVIIIALAFDPPGGGYITYNINHMITCFGITFAFIAVTTVFWFVFGLKSTVLKTHFGDDNYIDKLMFFKKSESPEKSGARARVIIIACMALALIASGLVSFFDLNRMGVQYMYGSWYKMEWDDTAQAFIQDANYNVNDKSYWPGSSFHNSFYGEIYYSYDGSISEMSGKFFNDFANGPEIEKAESIYRDAQKARTVSAYKKYLSEYKTLYESIAARIEEEAATERAAAEERAEAEMREREEAEKQRQELSNRLAKAVQTPIYLSNSGAGVDGTFYVWGPRRGNDISKAPFEFIADAYGAANLPIKNETDLVIPIEAELHVNGPNSLFSYGSEIMKITLSAMGDYGYNPDMFYNIYFTSGWNEDKASQIILWESSSHDSSNASTYCTIHGYIVIYDFYDGYSDYSLPLFFRMDVEVGYYIYDTVYIQLPYVFQ